MRELRAGADQRRRTVCVRVAAEEGKHRDNGRKSYKSHNNAACGACDKSGGSAKCGEILAKKNLFYNLACLINYVELRKQYLFSHTFVCQDDRKGAWWNLFVQFWKIKGTFQTLHSISKIYI